MTLIRPTIDEMKDAETMLAAYILERAADQGAETTDFRNTVVPHQDRIGAPIGFKVEIRAITGGWLPVTIEWTPHRSQGRRRQLLRMEAAVDRAGRPSVRLAKRIDEKLRDIARLQMRERTVFAFLDDHTYPAWSFSIHATIAGMLSRYGLDAGCITRTGRRDGTIDLWSASRMDMGIQTARLEQQGVHPCLCRPGAVRAEMAGSRLTFRSISFSDIGMTIEEVSGVTVMYLERHDVPETMRMSMKGRNVASVISHPGLHLDDGVTITGTVTHPKTGDLGLRLSNVRKPLAPTPEGVDATWLTE